MTVASRRTPTVSGASARQAAARPARPGEDERVEDELGRDVRGQPFGRPGGPVEERHGVRRVDGRGDRRQLVEQDRVVDRPGAARADRGRGRGRRRSTARGGPRRRGGVRWPGSGPATAVVVVGIRRRSSPSAASLVRPAPAAAAAEPAAAAAPRRRPARAGAATVGSAADSSRRTARSHAGRGPRGRQPAAGPASVMSSRTRVSSARMSTASGARA